MLILSLHDYFLITRWLLLPFKNQGYVDQWRKAGDTRRAEPRLVGFKSINKITPHSRQALRIVIMTVTKHIAIGMNHAT